MLPFFYISGFVNGVSAIIFGFLILIANPQKKLNRLFSLLCIFVAFWAISYGIWFLAKDYEESLLWTRMVNFGSLFIPIFFCHWVLTLLEIEKEKRNKIILSIGYLFTLFLAFFAFPLSPLTSYFVRDVEPELYFPYWPKPGILHPSYLLLGWGGLVGYAFYCLFATYRKASSYTQQQIKYVLIASLLGFGGGGTNYFLWYNIPIAPYGNPLVALYPFIIGYAIIKYRFMDIRWILGRTGIYTLSLLIVLFYTFSLFFINQFLGGIISPVAIGVFAVFTSIFLFIRLFSFFEKLAGKYFYYSLYNLQRIIRELGRILNQYIELDKLSRLISRSLLDALKLDKIGILLLKREEGKRESTIKFPELIKFKEDSLSLLFEKENRFLIQYLQETKEPLVREEMPFLIEEFQRNLKKAKTEKEENQIKEKISKLPTLAEPLKLNEIALLLPLILKEELIGILILGDKISRDAYTKQDIDLLSTLSSQTGIAFNNALALEEIEERKNFLERMYKATVGRELRMIELKEIIKKNEKKIKELEEKLKKCNL